MSQPQPQGRGCPVCFMRGAACKCGMTASSAVAFAGTLVKP
jgi:hypothetical protein